MAKRTAVAKAVDDISEAVPHLIRLPQKKALTSMVTSKPAINGQFKTGD